MLYCLCIMYCIVKQSLGFAPVRQSVGFTPREVKKTLV